MNLQVEDMLFIVSGGVSMTYSLRIRVGAFPIEVTMIRAITELLPQCKATFLFKVTMFEFTACLPLRTTDHF